MPGGVPGGSPPQTNQADQDDAISLQVGFASTASAYPICVGGVQTMKMTSMNAARIVLEWCLIDHSDAAR
jgi:hypothetical protein